jgi:hypothetical protein
VVHVRFGFKLAAALVIPPASARGMQQDSHTPNSLHGQIFGRTPKIPNLNAWLFIKLQMM